MDQPKRLHVDKPWGSFDQFSLNEKSTVKILTCLPGHRLSLQKHTHRAELWIALDSGAVVEIDGQPHRPEIGESLWLPVGSTHRLSCPEGHPHPVRILEISFGTFDEADIQRIEDNYGRTP
ncbi:MAG: phosphomannose isomerase type II C-terminal cupin domain [Holophagaceae bacterium]|jgi:mannose-1-phosphate guanylyltransferase/mannose-6-phosphate isomerase